MKKNYEHPVMVAEEYKVNSYCGSCGAVIKNGILTTSSAGANSSNNGRGNWKPGTSGFTTDNLVHTFDNDKIFQTVEGLCTPYPDCGEGNKWQSVWQCNCTNHPGETWYLEWSHYFSVHQNKGADTFFLYKEVNDPKNFNITEHSNRWPAIEPGSDYNVAQIVFTEGESLVINS